MHLDKRQERQRRKLQVMGLRKTRTRHWEVRNRILYKSGPSRWLQAKRQQLREWSWGHKGKPSGRRRGEEASHREHLGVGCGGQ